VVTPSAKRQVVQFMANEHRVPVQRACAWAGLSRAAYYRKPVDGLQRDEEVIEALNDVVERHGRWGFWKCYRRLRLDGRSWNHKRVWRVYCEMGLNLPRRTKRRVPQREPVPLDAGVYVNQCDRRSEPRSACHRGRHLDSCPAAHPHAQPLDRLVRGTRRDPAGQRTGDDLASVRRMGGCEGDCAALIAPGEPNQNAYIERFNRTYRNEVLDAYLFKSIEQVQHITEEWLPDYNERRPHDAQGGLPPRQFLPRITTAADSSSGMATRRGSLRRHFECV
jgi:putative transposase